MALRILNLNTKGLSNAQSRFELLLLYVIKEQISILLLQETHLYKLNNVLHFKSMFNTNQTYFNFDINQRRGVGVVFKNQIFLLKNHMLAKMVDKYILMLSIMMCILDLFTFMLLIFTLKGLHF